MLRIGLMLRYAMSTKRATTTTLPAIPIGAAACGFSGVMKASSRSSSKGIARMIVRKLSHERFPLIMIDA